MAAACGDGEEAATTTEAAAGAPFVRLVMPQGPGPTDPLVILANDWALRLSDRTDGLLQVDVFHSGQLGSSSETYQATIDGTIDMMWGGVQNLQDIPALAYLEAGYVWQSRDHVLAYLSTQFEDDFRDQLEAINLVYLGFAPGEPRVISTAGKQVFTPDDLDGLLIRAPEFEGLFESINAMGAASTIIPFPELYVSLETGVVDGQENPLTRVAAQKFYEVQDYVALTDHVWEVNLMLIHKDAWDALPPEYQQIMIEETESLAADYLGLTEQALEEAIIEIEASGTVINEVDQSLFRVKTLETMESRYREIFGDDLWESIQALG